MVYIPYNIFLFRFFIYLQIQICWCMGSTTNGNHSILDECCCIIISQRNLKFGFKCELARFSKLTSVSNLIPNLWKKCSNVPEKFSKPRKMRDLPENRACTRLGWVFVFAVLLRSWRSKCQWFVNDSEKNLGCYGVWSKIALWAVLHQQAFERRKCSISNTKNLDIRGSCEGKKSSEAYMFSRPPYCQSWWIQITSHIQQWKMFVKTVYTSLHSILQTKPSVWTIGLL